jgi:hypothetical protein
MAFTQADLDALDTALKTGALEVRFQDRTVRYATPQQMLDVRTLIYGELYGATGSSSSSPIRQLRIRTSKGV